MVQGNHTVEQHEIRFMELVKYVSYMDTDQCQVDRFIYGFNPKIREMVQMWKPSLVTEAVEHASYVEENLDLKGGNITIFPQNQGLWGRPLIPSPGEEVLGHHPMEIGLYPEHRQWGFQWLLV